MDLTQNSSQDTALDILILASPPGAEDDVDRAVKVGKLVHDLWILRAMNPSQSPRRRDDLGSIEMTDIPKPEMGADDDEQRCYMTLPPLARI